MAERLAYFGISLFFVLSGFVIQYNYSSSIVGGGWREIYNFLVARIARIYPLYISVVLFCVCTTGSAIYFDRPEVVISHLTLTQSWFGTFRAFFPATWTISTEWFFYLAFIPLARPISMIKHPIFFTSCFIVVGMILYYITFLHQGELVALALPWVSFLDQGDLSLNLWNWLTYYSPITRVFEFIVGCLCAQIYTQTALRPRPVLTAIGIMWCGAIIFFGDKFDSSITGILPNCVYLPAISIIILSSCGIGIMAKILSFRPIVFAGDISYSVYLIQGIAVTAIFRFFTFSFVTAILCLIGVTLLSSVTWLLIERPFRYQIRRLAVSNTPVR